MCMGVDKVAWAGRANCLLQRRSSIQIATRRGFTKRVT